MKLLHISILSFFFIATSALALHKISFPKKTVVIAQGPNASHAGSFPGLPVLSENSSFPVLSAQAVLAIDLPSGVTLYEKNPDGKLLPASTTKMVTAMVALESYDLNQILKVDGISVEGQRMGLYQGEEMTVQDLLYGLLIYSANDAAEVLADNYCLPIASISAQLDKLCGRSYFIEAMNDKMKDLSLLNTHFKNPSGLEETGHMSTARDLLSISNIAMRDPFFRKAVGIRRMTVESVDGKVAHRLTNINQLLGEVDGVKGVKTGWTENARENLVAYVERDGKKIMTVVLGSQDRFGETKELIEWIFDSYNWQNVQESTAVN